MTKSVTRRALTATDALILSPVDAPRRPDVLPTIFDDFERGLFGIEAGRLYGSREGGRMCVCASPEPSEDRPVYALTAVLADGRTDPGVVPGGRITRDLVAAFLRCRLSVYDRDPSWGVRSDIRAVREDGRVETRFAVHLPLVDPIRDGARRDDDRVLPVAVEYPEPWRRFFGPWEHLDGLLGSADANRHWMERRKRPVQARGSRAWWEIRGIHEKEDPDYYHGLWPEPRRVVAYLGWPAYLLDAVGAVGRCEHCRARTLAGRRYCGAGNCKRERAALRKQSSRDARSRLRADGRTRPPPAS